MLDQEFYFDGDKDMSPGRWKVRQISGHAEYKCVRVSGGASTETNIDNFAVGYVIRQWMEEQQSQHERGTVQTRQKRKRR